MYANNVPSSGQNDFFGRTQTGKTSGTKSKKFTKASKIFIFFFVHTKCIFLSFLWQKKNFMFHLFTCCNSFIHMFNLCLGENLVEVVKSFLEKRDRELNVLRCKLTLFICEKKQHSFSAHAVFFVLVSNL